MCIIVHIPAGADVDDKTLNNCFDNNPDGAGFVSKDKETGLLTLRKGFFSFKDFLEAYTPFKGNELLLHFRIKTHGNVNMENTHPFAVNDRMAFAHNGIISNIDTKNKEFSDTWHFNENIIKPLTQRFSNDIINSPEIQQLITEYIGPSRLVFIQEGKENTTWIFNKKAGEVVNGVWYSNGTFKYSRNFSTVGYSRQGTFHAGLDRDNYYTTQSHTNAYNSAVWDYSVGTIVEVITDMCSFCFKGEYGTIIKGPTNNKYEISIWTEKNNWEAEVTGEINTWQVKRA